MKIEAIKKMAVANDWELLDHQDNIGMVSFSKNINDYRARINVWLTKMTVSTAINHPRKGKTQLYRKNVDRKLLTEIFKNPRIHTDRGYRTK